MKNLPFPLPSRREWLRSASCGFGYLAFAALATRDAAAANPLAPRQPHFTPRAKRVIMIFLSGGPSQVDTFDYKPELQARDGEPVPSSVAAPAKKAKVEDRLLASPWKFLQHGQSGQWISELFPALATHADKLCIVNSMHCDTPAHIAACRQWHTGNVTLERPSLGAWTLYGLGSENDSLPGFVTIGDLGRGGGPQNCGSAFLPGTYQGTPLGSGSIAHLANERVPRGVQQAQVEAIGRLNAELVRRTGADPQLDAVVESYELAFRMQRVAPEVLDLHRETQHTLEQYGIGGGKPTDSFGRSCLLARRMAEAGVRFIEIGGGRWDHHTRLREEMAANCAAVDRPIAALLADLQQRGLLDDTLVLCSGEFGRLPANANPDGRDHNNDGFSMWLAGGGVRGGLRHGATDPLGFAAVEKKVHVHDLHATALHLLGLDHTRLTYRYSGRDFRLTDVYGNVVRDILG